MSGSLGQLTLAFPLNAQCRFSNFVAGSNEELVRRLEDMARVPRGFAGCFVWGGPSVGKTHLLQAACQQQGEAGRSTIYLPLADPEVQPALLDGLEQLHLVALDDLECWIGQRGREQALLGLYQGLMAAGGQLLVSAGARRLNFAYEDLGSRIRGLPTYLVQPLDDPGKGQVIRRLAAERGLALDGAVLDYWFSRGPRALADLIAQLDALDQAALAAQRRLTIPLLKAVLGL